MKIGILKDIYDIYREEQKNSILTSRFIEIGDFVGVLGIVDNVGEEGPLIFFSFKI